MKTMVVVVLALIGGFVAGVMLSEVIAIIGVMLFKNPAWLRWLKYSPLLTAFVGAMAALIVMDLRARR